MTQISSKSVALQETTKTTGNGRVVILTFDECPFEGDAPFCFVGVLSDGSEQLIDATVPFVCGKESIPLFFRSAMKANG